MYNDEQNLYHYTYRKDGTEPGQRYDAKQPTVDEQLNSYRQQQEQQTQNSQPVYQSQPQGGQMPHKNGKNRLGLKITSLALVCALLGGLVGGGTAYLVGNHSGSDTTEVNVSNRKPTEIQVKTVDGKTTMTDAELYAANINSVVAINITATSEPNFFGQTTETAGAGSGFILTPDGYIVTNYHVVGDADTVKVTLYNGDTYDAQYIGGDEDYDIAVIKIDAADLPNVTLGNSDSLNVGDHVLAIGNPLGDLTFSMSEGIASSVNRTIDVEGTPFNMIQVTAAINPGNSGGALVDADGKLIGINTLITSYSGNYSGVGFAIPVNYAINLAQQIIAGETPTHAQLGVSLSTVSAATASRYGLPVDTGAYVAAVTPDSGAAAAGIVPGDIVTAFDGQAVESASDLMLDVRTKNPGDTVTLTVNSGGQEKEVQVTLGDDSASQKAKQEQQSQEQSMNGYSLEDLFGRQR